MARRKLNDYAMASDARSRLSLLAQFDDIVRCNAQLTVGVENEFLKFVRGQSDCFKKWKTTIEELDSLQHQLLEAKGKYNLAETKLKHMRSLIEKEIQKRLKIENEKRSLERQIAIIKEVLLADQSNLNDQAKEKLAFLSTNRSYNEKKNSPHSHRLDTIEESMGSVLSASDVSFDKTDDDLDQVSDCGYGNTQNHSRSRSQRTKRRESSHRQYEDDCTSKKPKLLPEDFSEKDDKGVYFEDEFRHNIETNPEIRVLRESLDKNFILDTPSDVQNVNYVNTRSRSGTPMNLRLSSAGRLNRAHTFCTKTVIRPETCMPCGKRIKFYKQAFKCKDCRMTCHPECKDAAPLPCIPTMQTPTPTGKGVQGNIADYAPSSPPMVPPLLVLCISEIEKRGLSDLGLYRISGSERDVKDLKDKLMKGKPATTISKLDIHAVCSAVKEFFRSLDEPLVTRALWKEFVKVAETQENGNGDSLEELYSVIEQLPQANRDTLAFLMLHLNKVSESPKCKMPVDNLAKVFGPTIVGYSAEKPSDADMISDTACQFIVMEMFFKVPTEYWATLLGMENEIFLTPEPRPAPEGNLLGPLSGSGYNPSYKSRGVVVGKTPLTPRVGSSGSLKTRRQFFSSPLLK